MRSRDGLLGPPVDPRCPGRGLVGQPGDDGHRGLLVLLDAAVESPDDRRAQVVQVAHQPPPPRQLVATPQAPAHLGREGGEVLGVAPPPPVGLPVLVEALPAVLAEGLQQLVAGVLPGLRLGHHHRLGHQAAQRIDHVPALDPLRGDHGGGRRQGEPAGEHGGGRRPAARWPTANRRTSPPRPAGSGGAPPPSAGPR